MGPHTSQCKTPVQVIMSLETKKTGPGQVLHESVPRVIRELLNTEPHADTDRVYRRAVGLVVQKLLSQVHRNDAPPSLSAAVDGSSCLEEMAQQIGPLTPAEVGEIYEYLRGFKLEIKSPEQSVMVPNIMGKRNQGLFYTPKVIVSYIVEQTLDAMAVKEPSRYLDLRILDPAVGTGLFLAETLDQITGRVLSALRLGDKLLISRVDNISQRLQMGGRNHLLGQEQNKEAAVRIHILQKCLYGVDLDSIAVNIARAHLWTRAFGQKRVIPEFGAHVRIGNALLGDGTRDPNESSKENCDRRHAAAYLRETAGVWRGYQRMG